MIYRFLNFIYILFFLYSALYCFRVNVTGDNKPIISLNISDVNNNNTFYILMKSNLCYQSGSLSINSNNIVDQVTTNETTCSHLAINQTANNNTGIEIIFNTLFNYSTNYKIYLIIQENITLNTSFFLSDGKSSVVRSVNISNMVKPGFFQVNWVSPATANGDIVAYVAMFSDATGKCLYKWTLLCADYGSLSMGNKDAINVTCLVNSNILYNKSSQSFSIVAKKSVVTLSIEIAAVNGYGWGHLYATNLTFNQTISQIVRNLTVEFRSATKTITASWVPPELSNGDILQYVIWLTSLSSNSCIGWAAINYSTKVSQIIGTEENPGIKNSCPNIAGTGIFTNSSNNISAILVLPNIHSCTQYLVSVAAIVEYSWGNISTASFTFFNCNVLNFRCDIKSPNSFLCIWNQPNVYDSVKVNYTFSCGNETLHSDLTELQFYNVVSGVTYTCKVIACLPDGCGPLSIANVTLPPQDYSKIVNVTAAANVMSSSTHQSTTTTTIPIVLPLSLIKEEFRHIVNFSLVIVASFHGVISNSSFNPNEKTYSECNKGIICPYIIHLPLIDAPSRRKRSLKGRTWSDRNFNIGDNSGCLNGTVCNGPLQSNTEYLIGLRVCSGKGCLVITVTKRTSTGTPVVTIVVVTVAVLILTAIIIISFVVVYLRRRSKKKSEQNSLLRRDRSDSIMVNKFEAYYRTVVRDSCELANTQFFDLTHKWNELIRDNKLTYVSGNGHKDRYTDIRPYEHNVVRLLNPIGYINASTICMHHLSMDQIRQCKCTNCYIVTQGPLGDTIVNKDCTIGDFWRMCFQYKIQIIINLTKCIEMFKEKCAQYWPLIEGATDTHTSGDLIVTVTLVSMVSKQGFDERLLTISMNGIERSVTQLHFIAWPDHGCPNNNVFLEYYNRFTFLRRKDDAVLIHCSAGVGRSGTFVLIDIELRKIVSPCDRIDIYKTMLDLRQCRCHMVQNEKQYVFVHSIIMEYLKQQGFLTIKGNFGNGKYLDNQVTYSNPCFE